MLTKEELTEIYKKFDDEKIINLAKFESKKLTDLAAPVLIKEISDRNLGNKLIDWINLERNFFKGVELEIVKSRIKNSTCPNCKTRKNDIQGFFIHNCSLTHNPPDANLILCKNCGIKIRKKNYQISATFGWLSRTGFIKVPFYFLGELFDYFRRTKQSENILEEFIFENTGKIRSLKTDDLTRIIKTHNNRQLGSKRSDDMFYFELIP
jgi:hypothetical protein